jgi:GNAT superfamily N-acetyltransferase
MSITATETAIAADGPRSTISPDDPVGHVRKASGDDTRRLARVLARAFADDPVSAWFLPDDSDRLERLERMYQLIFLPDALGHDECYTTGDRAGAALWTPPGQGKLSLMENLRLMPTIARIWGRGTPRALRGLSHMESNYPEKPHYHLVFLGVEPEEQGQGIGSRLMRPTLRRFDREGMPAYLEASTPRNRALYLRHGFEVLDEMRLPGDGPPLWRMWREPA